MRSIKLTRSVLMACSTIALVSACTDAEVASIGDSGPVTVGDGGGTTTPTGPDLDFVPASGCPAGTETREITSGSGTTISACGLVGANG
ncbi:MAG: hypothetical protein AAF742_08030, partial [Pseudomonadota bacterium]